MVYNVFVSTRKIQQAKNVTEKLIAFLRDEEALTVIEYAVAAGLITATITAALLALGIAVNTIITTLNAFMTP